MKYEGIFVVKTQGFRVNNVVLQRIVKEFRFECNFLGHVVKEFIY
jgi:hypothetical protein